MRGFKWETYETGAIFPHFRCWGGNKDCLLSTMQVTLSPRAVTATLVPAHVGYYRAVGQGGETYFGIFCFS